MADKKWMTSHVLDNVDTYFGASKKRKAKAQILNQITCMCVFASEMKRTREKVGGRRENRAKDRKQKTVEMWNISSWMVPSFVCVCDWMYSAYFMAQLQKQFRSTIYFWNAIVSFICIEYWAYALLRSLSFLYFTFMLFGALFHSIFFLSERLAWDIQAHNRQNNTFV